MKNTSPEIASESIFISIMVASNSYCILSNSILKIIIIYIAIQLHS